MYDDDFVLALPDNFLDAAVSVFEKILEVDNFAARESPGGVRGVFPASMQIRETRALILELAKSKGAPEKLSVPLQKLQRAAQTVGELEAALATLHTCIKDFIKQQKESADLDRFSKLLGNAFHYEFSDADVKRMQKLINDLRTMLSESSQFDKGHKQRLLARLEALQKEIHRRVSNLDRFYGLVGDAGVLLGKFGHDSKPFVERISEIAQIVWRSQASAEQLPASARPALLRMEEAAEMSGS